MSQNLFACSVFICYRIAVSLIAALVLLTLAVPPASAWIPGHMLSGAIAYQVLQQENPQIIDRVKAMLGNLEELKSKGNAIGGITFIPVEGYGSCGTSPTQSLPSVDFLMRVIGRTTRRFLTATDQQPYHMEKVDTRSRVLLICNQEMCCAARAEIKPFCISPKV